MSGLEARPGAVPQTQDGWVLEQWREVLTTHQDTHPFVTPEWQRAWWDHFGAGALSVVPVAADGRPVGVAALARDAAGVVRFLGGEELTDYPGPVVAPGHGAEVSQALLAWLRGRNWSEFDVRNARPVDGIADVLAAAAIGAGLRVERCADEPVAVLALPATWDDYLALLSKHSRHELRRKDRRLERELPEAAVRTSDGTTLAADLETFSGLHRQSRGVKGSFLTAPVEAFFRRIADDFLARGCLRLDLLEDRGRPLAATLGFQSARTFYLYNMAFDPADRALSPGLVLLSRLLRRAIGDGLERFDFMRGDERYKLELGAEVSRLQRVRIFPA
jgi:CelD/BcsL family acetyltransferase involved in cellulose biosynthesis